MFPNLSFLRIYLLMPLLWFCISIMSVIIFCLASYSIQQRTGVFGPYFMLSLSAQSHLWFLLPHSLHCINYGFFLMISSQCLLKLFFLRQSLTLVAQVGVQRWDLSKLHLPVSNYSPASASGVGGITGTCHHTQLIFVFLIEMRFYYVDQAGLELLGSSDPPALASQNARIVDVSHCA